MTSTKILTLAADGSNLSRGNRNTTLENGKVGAATIADMTKAIARAGKRCVSVQVGTFTYPVVNGAAVMAVAPAKRARKTSTKPADLRDGKKPGIITAMCNRLTVPVEGGGHTVAELVDHLAGEFGRDPRGLLRTVRTQLSRLPISKGAKIVKVRDGVTVRYSIPSA